MIEALQNLIFFLAHLYVHVFYKLHCTHLSFLYSLIIYHAFVT